METITRWWPKEPHDKFSTMTNAQIKDLLIELVISFNNVSNYPDIHVSKTNKILDAKWAYQAFDYEIRSPINRMDANSLVEVYLTREAYRLLTVALSDIYKIKETHYKLFNHDNGIEHSITIIKNVATTVNSETYLRRISEYHNNLGDIHNKLIEKVLFQLNVKITPVPKDKNGFTDEDYIQLLKYHGLKTKEHAKTMMRFKGASTPFILRVTKDFPK